jgi:hypothetical protein
VGSIREQPIYSSQGTMPEHIGSWIAEGKKGERRLQSAEVAKGKGVPSEWLTKGLELDNKAVAETTCLHIWSAVCNEVGQWLWHTNLPPSLKGGGTTAEVPLSTRTVGQPSKTTVKEEAEWAYELPDLSFGGAWYEAQVRKLKEVVQGRSNAKTLLREGLEALEIHRGNYTDHGPKYLQVLWWEFPETHREAVRVGSSMRFLVDPGTELVENPPLTPEQLEVVCEFVEELRSLGVLRPATRPLRRVCPLFVVEKPGQKGQWHCIADMKRGGQNACCGLDPIFLPSMKDILPHLYEGGWSAIADASKYFHNFPTLPEEQDLIGLIHPRTGEHLWYVGLPMGAANSPSATCHGCSK